MSKLSIVILLAALFSGFRSIQAQMELADSEWTDGSAGECGSVLTAVRTSRRQLDKLDYIVQRIAPDLKDNMELRFYKLLEKIEHFVESKFNALDNKIDNKFQDTRTYLETKLTVIENKITQCYSHIDSKVNILEVSLTHALNNVSDTLNKNNTCCQRSSGTAAVVVNATRTIDELKTKHSGTNITLEVNVNIHNLTDLVSGDPSKVTKELVHGNTTTADKKPAPSKCYRRQQEECCTAAVLDAYTYKEYKEMSARRRHTVVNMTSAGLQEYTMYFAVRGEQVQLVLTPISPVKWDYLYFGLGFSDNDGGKIWMWERLPTVSETFVYELNTNNVISVDHYTYYYVHISGDTLEVGRRGEPPLTKHTSTELRRLKYFSFEWKGSTAGKALYDCTAE